MPWDDCTGQYPGEYYLTDVIEMYAGGRTVNAVL